VSHSSGRQSITTIVSFATHHGNSATIGQKLLQGIKNRHTSPLHKGG
jgi:hypothetical protein